MKCDDVIPPTGGTQTEPGKGGKFSDDDESSPKTTDAVKSTGGNGIASPDNCDLSYSGGGGGGGFYGGGM